MSDFDWLDLDARLLRLLVAVVDAGSVTGAAEAIGVSQSAVSHLLGKLRAVVGDELFVRSGRGIAATPRALVLADRARDLLRGLERFAAHDDFDPARWKTTFTIAANDFQRDALLPQLVARLRREAPGVVLRVIASNVPTLEMLREGAADLVISPRPPDGADVMQKRLFEDRYRVFYDANTRAAPVSEADYLAAAHATVVYEPRRSLDLDARLAERGVQRRFALMVPGFSALPAFLFGSDLVATVPGLLRFGPLRGLAHVAPPIPCPTMPMYMIWSRRRHDDPAHRWVRDEVEACARRLAADVA